VSVVLFSGDLMIASRVEGAARRCAVDLTVVASADQCVSSCSRGNVALVLVDLATCGSTVGQLVAQVQAQRAEGPAASIVAFGPHVQRALLESARDAGCDEVLSRGGFHQQVERVLRQYANATPAD